MFLRCTLLAIILSIITGVLNPSMASTNPKKYDLVLIHGFTNRHQWGEDFLEKLAYEWGSGRIFIIYSDEEQQVWTRTIAGKRITCIGKNNYQAGIGSVEEQADIISKKMDILIQKYGLSPVQQIIAHSMGGLVARQLIYMRPKTIAHVVTVGTPHHGTKIADEYEWIGWLLAGEKAVANMKPIWLKKFNRDYPVKSEHFFADGKLFTIAGESAPFRSWGWIGELCVGWTMLTLKYGNKNDGVINEREALIDGGIHVKTFKRMDHFELIQRAHVAEKIVEILE